MQNLLTKAREFIYPSWVDDFRIISRSFPQRQTLHVGCGRDQFPGAIRLDINPQVAPDIVWDLNRFPYPFADNAFDICIALSIVEHLEDFLAVLQELHRVTKDGGVVCILVPHFSSSAIAIDPTHKIRLSARSCDYFVKGTTLEQQYGFYTSYRYRLITRKVSLHGALDYIPFLSRYLSAHPAFWEDYLCFVLRGGGIYWELSPIK